MSLLSGYDPGAPVRTHEERLEELCKLRRLPEDCRLSASRTSTAPPAMQLRPSGARLAPVLDECAVRRIQAAAATHFGVDVTALMDRHGPGSPVAHARRVAVFIARHDTASSTSSVARTFGMSVAGAKNAIAGVKKSTALMLAADAVRRKLEAA